MTFTNSKRANSSTETTGHYSFLVELMRNSFAFVSVLTALPCLLYESAEGVVIERPKDATVIINQSTIFNCSMSDNKQNEPIWYHHPFVGARQDVYYNARIKDRYKDRFSIDKNLASRTFNLLVLRPETADAGRYECVEDVESDTGPSAELTVLDSNLVCDSHNDLNEIVGPTDCVKPIAPDQVQLSCSVTYSGNIPPQIQWRKVDSELQSIETKCDVRGNRVTCNATLEANLNMDGSVYICHIITAEQYNCSLKVKKIIYAFSDTSGKGITTAEEAFCFANTSIGLSCSYKWYKDKTIEKSDQTLKPNNPGIYRCEAECGIRNETCALTAMIIYPSEAETSKAVVIVGLLITAMLVIVALVVGLFLRGKICEIAIQCQKSRKPKAFVITKSGIRKEMLLMCKRHSGNLVITESPAIDSDPQKLLNDKNLLLDESKISILDNNAEFLKENIDCENGLLDYLVQNGAITQVAVDSIHTNSNTSDKIEALLGIIRRGNRRQYELTAEALKASNQGSIADVLEHGADAVKSQTKPQSARLSSVSSSAEWPTITDQDMADKLIINQYFIDKGASGAIYGPFRWKDKKCVLKQMLFSPDKLTKETEEEIIQLRHCCITLDHPHLVKVFEVWFSSPALCTLMEYAEGRSLDKILRPKDASSPLPPFTNEIVKDWALQIADGMRYLHGHDLVHRNLKSAQVMVMELPEADKKTLKIGSPYQLVTELYNSTLDSIKGTMAWMAPEYLLNGQFSKFSDVWSYGVTVWEMLTRDVPHKEVRKETDLLKAAINKPLKLEIPESCPKLLQDLLTECWNYEAEKRPSFTEIYDRLSSILVTKSILIEVET